MRVLHRTVRIITGIIGIITVFMTALSIWGVSDGYRFNTTSSAPVGIWKISERNPSDVGVGQYVLICPPVHDVLSSLIKQGRMFKGHCDSGTVPFIKTVAAQGSGRFRVGDDGVYIDDRLIPQTAPYPWENLKAAPPANIDSGEFVAIQTMHVGSIDSRYFGPLKVDNVIGVIEPIWIF